LHLADLLIFVVYVLTMVWIGIWFHRRNRTAEDFYVGGRQVGSLHVGLSVVATDVGGGFSIGLGGLGFVMGLSGSWMLFTGLLGAWLAAVLVIPRVRALTRGQRLMTFPQVLSQRYDGRVVLAAAVISGIGYLGFTASQILAGAKLAGATFPEQSPATVLIAMGVIVVGYTVLGGLKAVIYTDSVQWTILLGGLILIGIPIGYRELGGWHGITAVLPPQMLRLDNVGWVQLVNWAVTIIPIWFVGMTLYQRIYACRSEREARRAWFIAGLFEWPVMAFLGVVLGLFARVAMEQGLLPAGLEPEMGLPMFLRTMLPTGLLGLMLAAYFSAILSTADSCLMAASGNTVTDVIDRLRPGKPALTIGKSQLVTLVLGLVALLLASRMTNVLTLMLQSYAFMVSGLLVPTLAALFLRAPSSRAALAAMLTGGSVTVVIMISPLRLPLGLDANVAGITASLVVFAVMQALTDRRQASA
jgi:solute:Na+ symporter, SSS family